MKLFGYEFAKAKEDAPLPAFFKETARADSPFYEDYQLRPYNPDDLYQKKGNYDLFDEMRQDEQISALLKLKKFLILGNKWELQCEDEKVKDFLEVALYDNLDSLFEKNMFFVLSALDYGFSFTEKVFAYEEVEGYGKKIVLKKLKTIPPHTIDFYQDEYGAITKVEQSTGQMPQNLDYNKFIHYKYQGEFENPYGQSELNLGVYRAWVSKNAIIKFWNIYLERFGMPTVVGTYPQSLIAQKNDLKKVLSNIQAKTSIIIPEGIAVSLLDGNKGGVSGYEAAIDKYNQMISQNMLVPDLAGLSGSGTGGGSYALGREQFAMFYNNIKHEERNLLRTINREILNPLVMWNFGTGYSAEFVSSQVDDTKKEKDMTLWIEVLKTGKLPMNNEQLNWFLSQVGAPEIEQAELDEIAEEQEQMRQKISGEVKDEESAKEDKENDMPEEEKKVPADKSKENEVEEKKEEFTKYYRELTEVEKKVDFTKIENDFDTILEEYRARLGEMYKLQINALIDDIKGRGIVEKKRIDQINKLSLKYQTQINKIYHDLMKAAYNKGGESAKHYIIDTSPDLDDEEVVQWLKENSIYTSTTEAQEILKKVKGTLMDGIRDGAGVKDIMGMIDTALAVYDISLPASRIETIARTVTSKAYNESRKQQFNKVGDDIVAYQFSAIMDGRVSSLCSGLDGKIFPPNDLSYYNPPLHYNCRSLILPIIKDIDDFSGYSEDIPATEMESGGFLVLKTDADKKIKNQNEKMNA